MIFKCKCIANRKIQFSLLSSQDALLLFLSSTTQFDKKMQPLYATPLAKRTGGSISYLKAKTKKKGRRREKKKKSFSVKASTTQCLKIIPKVKLKEGNKIDFFYSQCICIWISKFCWHRFKQICARLNWRNVNEYVSILKIHFLTIGIKKSFCIFEISNKKVFVEMLIRSQTKNRGFCNEMKNQPE